MLPKLIATGVTDPERSRWRRLPGCLTGRLFAAEVVCWCTGEPVRVTHVPFVGGREPIVLGQCSRCLEITWSRWQGPDREWTGPRALEAARPMYRAGQGA